MCFISAHHQIGNKSLYNLFTPQHGKHETKKAAIYFFIVAHVVSYFLQPLMYIILVSPLYVPPFSGTATILFSHIHTCMTYNKHFNNHAFISFTSLHCVTFINHPSELFLSSVSFVITTVHPPPSRATTCLSH